LKEIGRSVAVMKKHLIKTIAVLLAVLLFCLAIPGLRIIFVLPFFDLYYEKTALKINLHLN